MDRRALVSVFESFYIFSVGEESRYEDNPFGFVLRCWDVSRGSRGQLGRPRCGCSNYRRLNRACSKVSITHTGFKGRGPEEIRGPSGLFVIGAPSLLGGAPPARTLGGTVVSTVQNGTHRERLLGVARSRVSTWEGRSWRPSKRVRIAENL